MSFSVSWDSYQNNICNGLSILQQNGKFVDMTIAADGHHVKVHQMVMSLVSPYINDLISSAECPHPVIFLNQVSYQTLHSILQYAYTGEVLVARDKISEFLEACKALHIKGVEDLGTTGQELQNIDNYSESLAEPSTSTNTSIKSQKSTAIQRLETVDSTASDEDTMDSTLNDDIPYHCGGSSPIPTKKKSSSVDVKGLSDNLQYTVSYKGNLQLVCNRYLYFLMSSRKSGERMWRCMTYKRKCSCRAFLVTKNNRIIKRVGAHTHTYHDSQILKRLNNGNMFSALNEVEKHVKSLKNNPSSSSSETPSNITSVIINQSYAQEDDSDKNMPQLR